MARGCNFECLRKKRKIKCNKIFDKKNKFVEFGFLEFLRIYKEPHQKYALVCKGNIMFMYDINKIN